MSTPYTQIEGLYFNLGNICTQTPRYNPGTGKFEWFNSGGGGWGWSNGGNQNSVISYNQAFMVLLSQIWANTSPVKPGGNIGLPNLVSGSGQIAVPTGQFVLGALIALQDIPNTSNAILSGPEGIYKAGWISWTYDGYLADRQFIGFRNHQKFPELPYADGLAYYFNPGFTAQITLNTIDVGGLMPAFPGYNAPVDPYDGSDWLANFGISY